MSDDLIRRLTEACPGCRCSYCVDDKRDARREIERLRAALMKIVECPHPIPRADGMVDMDWNPARMVQIAKEALGDE